MANSKYEYVKLFEKENYLLPDTYIIIRVDGKGFHKFSQFYEFEKPNDLKALQVMNLAAEKLMSKYSDVMLAYGDSDEYSFCCVRTVNCMKDGNETHYLIFITNVNLLYVFLAAILS